jgi:hypothetical protein
MAAAEPGRATLVFNGDHNWFNVDAAGFRRINDTVLQHVALRGNVETELAQPGGEAGCGCAYPAWVGDAEVARSNAIMARLRDTSRACPDLTQKLAGLPMYRAATVGGVRVAIVHGDAESLAGWGYAQERLRDRAHSKRVGRHFERANARVIASSHTCLPVAADFDGAPGRCVLINNGAAGMPNFRGTRHGIVTRIALTPARTAAYGTRLGPVHVEALAVHYDHDAWLRAFVANWPPGTPAHDSYYDRIAAGPRYEAHAAVRWRGTMSAAN